MSDIRNQEITETIYVKDLLSNQATATFQKNYPLTELDFELILNGKSQTNNWSHNLFLALIGYSLGLLEKYFNINTSITNSEWTALGIGILTSCLLYLIGLLLPHRRKKVIQNIKKHFENEPKQQLFMETK